MESETFISDDNLVIKIVHEDGSETAVKTVSSCDTIRNPVTGELEFNNVERNKYSVFASSSRGCFMNCNFCYLTIKNCEYKKLTEMQILNNLKVAIQEQMNHAPDTKNRYIKLCWMGMGEDQIMQPLRTVNLTTTFLDWVFDNNHAIGLDGVDLATVIPKTKYSWINKFQFLNKRLEEYSYNPNNKLRVHGQGMNKNSIYINRSPFRLFYSLHSAIQETRDIIIPNAMSLTDAIPLLLDYSDNNKNNLIFHHMFMEGQNDSEQEVDAFLELIQKYKLQEYEFRILRYNHCQNSPFGESEIFNNIIDKIVPHIPFLKVQISTGTEIRAACGQFIVKQFEKTKQKTVKRENEITDISDYFDLQQKVYDHFGYVEDWKVISIKDHREMFWILQEDENGNGDINYHETKFKDGYGEPGNYYYNASIYTQQFLSKWVYRIADYTMVCMDTHCDGNQYIGIFSNANEQTNVKY